MVLIIQFRHRMIPVKRPRGLRLGSAAAWVRIPPGTWMFVSCDCSVLSVRGQCVGLINRPEQSYRVGSWSPAKQTMTRTDRNTTGDKSRSWLLLYAHRMAWIVNSGTEYDPNS